MKSAALVLLLAFPLAASAGRNRDFGKLTVTASLSPDGRTLKATVEGKGFLVPGAGLALSLEHEMVGSCWDRVLKVPQDGILAGTWDLVEPPVLPGRYRVVAAQVQVHPEPLAPGEPPPGRWVAQALGREAEYQRKLGRWIREDDAKAQTPERLPAPFWGASAWLELRMEAPADKAYLESVLRAEALLNAAFGAAAALEDGARPLRPPDLDALLQPCRDAGGSLFPGTLRAAATGKLPDWMRALRSESAAHRLMVVRALARSPKAAGAREILALWKRDLTTEPASLLQESLLGLHRDFLAWLDAKDAPVARQALDRSFRFFQQPDLDEYRIGEMGLFWELAYSASVSAGQTGDGKRVTVQVEGAKPGLLRPGARVRLRWRRLSGIDAPGDLPDQARDVAVPGSGVLEASWAVEGSLARPGIYRVDALQHGPVPAATAAFEAEVEAALASGKGPEWVRKAAARPGWSELAVGVSGGAELGIGLERRESLEAFARAEASLREGFDEIRGLTDRMQALRGAEESVLMRGEDVIERGAAPAPEALPGVSGEWKVLHAEALAVLERLGSTRGFFPETRALASSPRLLAVWRSPSAVMLAQMLGSEPDPEAGWTRDQAYKLPDGILEPWVPVFARESLRLRLLAIEALARSEDPDREALEAWSQGVTDRELLLLKADLLGFPSEACRKGFEKRLKALKEPRKP